VKLTVRGFKTVSNNNQMEKAVQIFVVINLLIIGASHFFQPQAWVDFFKILRKYGKAGQFANGFLSLSIGSIIVAFHWVWEGIVPTIITCFGIAQVIKSVIAFVLPDIALKNMSKPIAGNPLSYKWVGAIFMVLSVLAAISIYKY
jgi:hypothetical protein